VRTNLNEKFLFSYITVISKTQCHIGSSDILLTEKILTSLTMSTCTQSVL